MKDKSILVTGGAGFIGSNIVAALEAQGHSVAVLDKALATQGNNIAKRRLAGGRFEPVALDRLLSEGAERFEAIVHMAAISETTATDEGLVTATNVTLSQRLWRLAVEAKIPFIYASSAATYGDGSHGFDDDPALLAKLKPLNLYGRSKAAFDLWAVAQTNRPPQWVGLKFFNVYGPHEWHKGPQQSVALQLFHQVRDSGVARLFASDRPDIADGDQQRDFISVDDCVAMVLWLLKNPQVSGIFNAGTGLARSFNALALAVFQALGQPPRLDYIAIPPMLKGRYQYFTQAPMARLQHAGFNRPPMSLEEGVRRYLQDCLMKKDPYR